MAIRFIADIGSNHNQNLNRALDLVAAAQEAGCWGVKFQLFSAQTLYRNPDPSHLEDLVLSELPEGFLPALKKYCQLYNIAFGCTPFSMKALDTIIPYVDFYKIGSYEILCTEMIRKAAEQEKPIFISLGMARFQDAVNAVKAAQLIPAEKNNYLTLFHCCSEYPAKPNRCELHKISAIREYFHYPVGWSDHSVSFGVIHSAVAMGAELIELHFDLLDQCGMETHHGHCWNPTNLTRLIKEIKEGQEALQDLPVDEVAEEKKLRQRMDPSDYSRPLKEA